MKGFFKKHKNLYAVLILVILSIVLIVALASIYWLKMKTTNDVVNYATKGYIAVDDYNRINFMGGLIFDKEFSDEQGNTYVLYYDNDQHIRAKCVKNVNDRPAHTHTWAKHYDKNGKPDYYYCTECISSEQLDNL